MEALILLALLWVLWLLGTRRWRRWLIQPIAILVLVYLLFTAPITIKLATRSLLLTLPTDSGETVNAIVVLGRGDRFRGSRAEVARELWRANRAPRIFISGMLDARLTVQLLQDTGVPKQGLSGEECSQNTEENGLYTAAILRPQGVQKILLVTDAPHLLRAYLTFRSFGFNVIPVSSSVPSEWNSSQQVYLLLREYLALAKYTFSDRLRPRTATELEHPPAEVLAKIKDWNCKVQGGDL